MLAPGPARRLAPLLPLLLVPALAALGFLAIWAQAGFGPWDARLSSWLTLTLSGLAMGMMIFLMASGLTLVFGLMDVINFGHAAFVSVGAFLGASVLRLLPGLAGSSSVVLNLLVMALAGVLAAAVTGVLGLVFERLVVRPVRGQHLRQILVTMGGLIVIEQLIAVIWGPSDIYVARPETLKGAVTFLGATLETYRLVAVAAGLAVFAALSVLMRRTRLGLIVRAGVENAEMVRAMGYRLDRVFLMVFAAGSALAGLGGVMWGLYQERVTAAMGGDLMVTIFIVVIIGGLGSVEGCFLAALMVGLTQNYVAFLAPKAALVSTLALMVAVLMWRPEGMIPKARSK